MSDPEHDNAGDDDTPMLDNITNWAMVIRLWVVIAASGLLVLVSVSGPQVDWPMLLIGLAGVALCGALLYFGRNS